MASPRAKTEGGVTARWLSFYWSPERQEIACDGERFAHPVATNTASSHDVAHLLAAAGGLPWKPAGTREEICYAEHAAVLLEHLSVAVLEAELFGRGPDALDRTLAHSRWFVEEHYAPFPVSFDEALDRFVRELDREAVVRLSPVLFRTRVFELKEQDSRERTLQGSFSSQFNPRVTGPLLRAREALGRELEALAARMSGAASV
jgi:hypothetical protein